MKRSSLCATLLAVGAMVLTPAFGYAGEKSPAERGAEDKAAAEKAHLDKIIKEQEAAEAKATKAPPADDTAKPVDAPKAVEPAPVAPATAPSAALPATELNLRPAHVLEPVAATPTLGLGTKLALAALIGAAAFLVYRRRAQKKPAKQSVLRVTARASIGARTEVCIVEVDGQRLLLGVTPSSIRTLTALTDEPMIEREAEPTPVAESLARLFASAKRDVMADEDAIEPPSVHRLTPTSENRPVSSIRSGRSTPSDSTRSNATSETNRSDSPKPTSIRKAAARRTNAAVEGQVSGLLAARAGRS